MAQEKITSIMMTPTYNRLTERELDRARVHQDCLDTTRMFVKKPWPLFVNYQGRKVEGLASDRSWRRRG